MNRNSLTPSALMALALISFAPAAEAATVEVSTGLIDHQLESARSAQDRLQLHLDRYCTSDCRRLEVDVGVVQGALINFSNQAKHGRVSAEMTKLDVAKAQQQFESVRSALGRMRWVASRQKDDHRRRVEVDVSIVTQVVQILENQVLNAQRAQSN